MTILVGGGGEMVTALVMWLHNKFILCFFESEFFPFSESKRWGDEKTSQYHCRRRRGCVTWRTRANSHHWGTAVVSCGKCDLLGLAPIVISCALIQCYAYKMYTHVQGNHWGLRSDHCCCWYKAESTIVVHVCWGKNHANISVWMFSIHSHYWGLQRQKDEASSRVLHFFPNRVVLIVARFSHFTHPPNYRPGCTDRV